MVSDILDDLRNALEADTDPWDATLYSRAIAEIELLRAELELVAHERALAESKEARRG